MSRVKLVKRSWPPHTLNFLYNRRAMSWRRRQRGPEKIDEVWISHSGKKEQGHTSNKQKVYTEGYSKAGGKTLVVILLWRAAWTSTETQHSRKGGWLDYFNVESCRITRLKDIGKTDLRELGSEWFTRCPIGLKLDREEKKSERGWLFRRKKMQSRKGGCKYLKKNLKRW